MNKEYNNIAAVIEDLARRKRLIMYRNDDELDFLMRWLQGERSSTEKGGILARDELIDMIQNCRRCKDTHDRKLGYGSGANGIMIILNTPRMVSQAEIKLFKSDSIKLLKKMIQAMEVDFESCYTTNMIKCETGDSLYSPSEMFINCEEIIKKEIALINPEIVIVMGEIVALQKIVNDSHDISWYNIEHPLTLIKNPDLKRSAWNTLKLVMARMRELGKE
jgi:uracil-DNA glycosylase family 4